MLLTSLFLLFPIVYGANNIRIQRDFRYQKYSGFPIYWNTPTFMCQKYGINFAQHMSKWGITANNNDTFRGLNVNILYDPGAYPALLKTSSGKIMERNGGIPQAGNLTYHLTLFQSVVEQLVPKNFSGVGVIDFEAYRVIFRQNWNDQEAYLKMSREHEMQKHPQWTPQQIEAAATKNFEEAARIYFESTLKLAKMLRPNGQWGYYGYPYCYNYRDNSGMVPWCHKDVQAENDRIRWLWTSSSGIFPSMYFGENLPSKRRVNFAMGRMNEAFRVASRFGGKQMPGIHPYVWPKYTDTSAYLSGDDIYNIIETIRRYQAGGVIIWGSSNDFPSKDKCQGFLDYLNNVLGPAILKSQRNGSPRGYGVTYNGDSAADITGNLADLDIDPKDYPTYLAEDVQFVPLNQSGPNVIYTAIGNNQSKSIYQYDTIPENTTPSSTTRLPKKKSIRYDSKSPYINPASVPKDLPILRTLVKRYNVFMNRLIRNTSL